MNRGIRAHQGFTLIELLTVIAIIALLAAIVFPVFNMVRSNQRRAACITQMHDIYRSLKLYYEDNNKYPASLVGYVQNSDGSFHTGSGQPVAIEELTYRPLTNQQKYIKEKIVFACPDNSVKDPNQLTTAEYPAGVPNTGPVLYNDIIANNIDRPIPPPAGEPAYFYKYDSYDIGPKLGPDGRPVPGPVYELHYSVDWTGVIAAGDPQNQLKYKEKAQADATVVTWCTHHAALAGSDMVNVLMLSGAVKPTKAVDFVAKGPLNFKF
jgi:prepilin-type N-terminal cleavage/methylation domain-containing protein